MSGSSPTLWVGMSGDLATKPASCSWGVSPGEGLMGGTARKKGGGDEDEVSTEEKAFCGSHPGLHAGPQ